VEEDLFWCASLPGKELEISFREKRGKFLSSLFSLLKALERENETTTKGRESGGSFLSFSSSSAAAVVVVCAKCCFVCSSSRVFLLRIMRQREIRASDFVFI